MAIEASGAVRNALTDLVVFLDATAASDNPDRTLAARAAVNIRATLAAINQAGDPQAVREAFKQAWYDTGDRGILEWAWSPATEKTLREHTERVGQALDRADRQLRHKARPT